MAKKKEVKQEVEMVTVECICKNVHLGNGVTLRAYRDSTADNWADGDRAEVTKDTADWLKKRKQVRIV